MAEIRVNVSANKTQKVEITPGQVQNQITATPDSSQYYSNLAKSWAIDENLVQGTDYSSKYYAGKSSESAAISESYANAAETTLNNVQVATETSLANIETARVDAVDNITTVKNESIASVEAKTSEGVNSLNTVKNTAINEINSVGISTMANKDLSNLSTAGQAKLDAKVSKSGDTMTGNLIIDRETANACITLNSDMVALGSSPSGGANTASIYFDQQSVITAIIQNVARADGSNGLQIALRDPSNTSWHSLYFMVNKNNTASFDFPKCTTKATTTSTASGSRVAVVVQNYKNGTSWYRVWSDGWIEQGGRLTTTSVTFLKAFSDTNYTVTTGWIRNTSNQNNIVLKEMTAKGFVIPTLDSGTGMWYACGY
jgi:hypothetical protein